MEGDEGSAPLFHIGGDPLKNKAFFLDVNYLMLYDVASVLFKSTDYNFLGGIT